MTAHRSVERISVMEKPESPSSKPSVKIRLAQKYVRSIPYAHASIYPAMEAAYLAGFERAKALCVDHAMRSLDDRIEYSTLDVPYLKVSGGLKPSQVLALIGE